MSLMFSGIGVSRGIALGEVYILRRNHPEVQKKELGKEEIPTEIRRFRKAMKKAHARLASVLDGIPESAPADVGAFIETHLLMLDDNAMSQRPISFIKSDGCNAEAALEMHREELIDVFNAMEDAYIATRIDDFNHVIDLILQALVDDTKLNVAHNWSGQIVVADDLTPADTLEMQNDGVAGFITETGGQLSHTAILARSLGIPAIVGVHNIRRYLQSGESIIVDGEAGLVLAEPDTAMVTEFRQLRKRLQTRQRDLRKLIDKPSITLDGVELKLQANIEMEEDLKSLRRVNADGVGLYRTEFLYINRQEHPDEQEHLRVYTKVVRALRGAPLTIRTVDLGADKEASAMSTGPLAHNPAMGLRGIRLTLSDTSMIVPQLRAILRASTKGPVRIMFPMLTTIQEVVQCRELVETVKQSLSKKKIKFDPEIQLGGMIEVPAAAIAADQFASELDFLSIGTNDLIQYTLAIDRIDDEVNYLYDPMHPSVLKLIQMTINAGHKHGIPVGMCGEMAGDPQYVRLLLGLGLTEFSMPPNSLLEVKDALNQSDAGKLSKLAAKIMKARNSEEQHKLFRKINKTENKSK